MPNTIAVIAVCFARLHQGKIEYRPLIEALNLKKQTKNGGFKKKPSKINDTQKVKGTNILPEDTADNNKEK